MKLIVSFKIPGKGISKLILLPKERLQFIKGVARRLPPDKSGMFNSVKIKYITSIRLEDDGTATKCAVCKRHSLEVLCINCIDKIAKKA